MIFADSSASSAVAWAPLVVAAGGLLTALVAGFTRRDRRQTDFVTTLDERTNTAIKGLSEAYDRADAERQRWQERAVAAEAKVEELDHKVEELEALTYLRSKASKTRRNDSSSAS